MSEIFKKLLLKRETPFLSKIVHFRHKIASISEKKVHSQKPQDMCLIIYHKEIPPAVLAKSRTRTPDHLLVSDPRPIKQPVRPLPFHLQRLIR